MNPKQPGTDNQEDNERNVGELDEFGFRTKYRVKPIHSLRQAFEWAASPMQSQYVISNAIGSKILHPDSKHAKSKFVKGVGFSRTARTVERTIFIGGLLFAGVGIMTGGLGLGLPLVVNGLFNLKCTALAAGALTEGCVRIGRALARNLDHAINGPDKVARKPGAYISPAPRETTMITNAGVAKDNAAGGGGQNAHPDGADKGFDPFKIYPNGDPRNLQATWQMDNMAKFMAERGDTHLAEVRGLHPPASGDNCGNSLATAGLDKPHKNGPGF